MYRDDVDALEARHQALEQELRDKMRERDAAAKLLADARKARLPILDNIRIASPCPVDWSSMIGDDRSRHCVKCDKTVFDLSSLTRDEAEALIVERAGNSCARYYQREDGKIQLADCSERRTRRATFAAVVLASASIGGTIAIARALARDEAPAVEPVRQTLEPVKSVAPQPEPEVAGVVTIDHETLLKELDRHGRGSEKF